MDKASLIAELIAQKVLKTPKSREAFAAVDRADFAPPRYKDQAYENYPLPIGRGQTISQPYTVAFMLDLLQPKPGEKILEIGAGSGWQTVLLARLAGKKGRVFAVERIEELKNLAEKNLSKYPLFYRTSTVIHGDGSLGYPAEAPFDKIIAAASGKEIPLAWQDQLKIGGRIVAPVRDSIVVLDKIGRDKFKETSHPGFAFVPLVSD